MEFVRVTFTKMPHSVTKKQRSFYERHARKQYSRYLAYENFFDKVLKPEEIERAKAGYLPEDLNTHHIFPISGGDTPDLSSFMNMSILHVKTHDAINKYIFQPQLARLYNEPDYSSAEIWLPQFKPVDAERIIAIRNGASHLTPEIMYAIDFLNQTHQIEAPPLRSRININISPKDMETIMLQTYVSSYANLR